MKKTISILLSLTVIICSLLSAITTVSAATYTSGMYKYEVSNSKATIIAYTGCEENIVIPTTINNYKVVEIANGAFSYKLDENVMKTVKSITIPQYVTSIGACAFGFTSGVVDDFTFSTFKVNSQNTSFSAIDGVLYNYNKTELVRCPIGKKASDLTIPSSVKSIKEYSFNDCIYIEKISMLDSVTQIGKYAFWGCHSLENINFSKGLKTLGEYAFSNCYQLKKVVLNYGLTTIGKYAFDSCDSLQSVYIPTTVSTIGESAFFRCDNINTVYIHQSALADTLKNTYFFKINTNHSYAYVVTEKATCTKQGTAVGTCRMCNTTITDTIPEEGHSKKITTTKATLTKNGTCITKCTSCGIQISNVTVYYPKTIKLSSTSYTYDGKVKKPSVIVKDTKGNAISANNYTVSYASGRKNIGKYSVKVTFKGNYSGTKTLYFKINPKKSSITSISSPKAGQIKLKWSKVSGVTGYELQISKSSSFSSGTKKYTVAKQSINSATAPLNKKTKYYVRIRTYKKVNGATYYSSWSSVKTIKTK